MNELFLIKGETLKATADTIRKYVNEAPRLAFDPAVVAGDGTLILNAVTVYYTEYVDDTNSYDGRTEGGMGDTVTGYSFLANNEGIVTPVIYDTAIYDTESGEYIGTEPDIEEPFFYQGKSVINGETFDKWRKIEGVGQSGGQFTWESEGKQYIYTNEIIIEDNSVSPIDFPEKIDEVYEKAIDTYKTINNANEEVY